MLSKAKDEEMTVVDSGVKEKIVVVDDDSGLLRFIDIVLSEQGYKIYPFSSGSAAIDLVFSIMPDLILLDIMMPEINGFEICSVLKADKRTCDIPIIFISTMQDITDQVKAFRVGGVDYITKPLQVEELLARIKTHIDLQNIQNQLMTQNTQLQQEILLRKQAEETLNTANEELEQLNNELEERVEERTLALVHANKANVESEKRLSLIYNSSQETMALLKINGIDDYEIESCNEMFIRANQEIGLNLTLDKLIGMAYHHFIKEILKSDSDKIDFIFKKYQEAAIAGNPVQYDMETVLNDITVYWDTTLTPILNNQGKCTHLLQVARDITQRKQAEEKLKKTLSELEKLKNQLQNENIYLQEEIRGQHNFSEIIGNSPVLKNMLNQVSTVATTEATVLLLGETGTGKELVARAIHSLSKRKNRPLVKVNCAALPVTLIESELFGHEKGAFTGATMRKIGRFELANRGTLFLDEIGDLPISLQAKLLRVIQEGEFERVGGEETLKVDVRLITATNRNLPEAIKENKFREDLYYRLNVFPLKIPALRERIEDIPLLARFFVDKFAKKMGKTIEKISKESIKSMQLYNWPGNIRELENIIERAVVFCKSNILNIADQRITVPEKSNSEQEMLSLEQLERQHILSVLNKTEWVVNGPKGAANILKIKPTTLRSRMVKLGIKKQIKNI